VAAEAALERGEHALADWAWADARAAFEEVLAVEVTPEALEGFSTAAAFCDDGAAAIEARERAFRMYREAGDDESAARAAILTALAIMDFRGEPAVATGWLQRGTTLLNDVPGSPWAAAADAIRGYMAWAYDKDMPLAIRLTQGALAAAEDLGDIHGEMMSKAQLGLILVSTGRLADGMRLLAEDPPAAVAGELGDP
jgi:tetratricopeptide (TPR) repeat protein